MLRSNSKIAFVPNNPTTSARHVAPALANGIIHHPRPPCRSLYRSAKRSRCSISIDSNSLNNGLSAFGIIRPCVRYSATAPISKRRNWRSKRRRVRGGRMGGGLAGRSGRSGFKDQARQQNPDRPDRPVIFLPTSPRSTTPTHLTSSQQNPPLHQHPYSL